MPREQFQSLTEPMYYILMSLQEECCGVDIMEKVKALSGGRVQVGPEPCIHFWQNSRRETS